MSITVATQAHEGQKPGTSGLRKKTAEFMKPNYTENFIQSILTAADKPKTLVVGGDGRFYSDEVIKRIVSISAANGVERIVIARNGILSTPAASALIRSISADGGIILTASHNPGGEKADFGIKYNCANGGAAPEHLTNLMYDFSKTITEYKTLIKRPQLDLSVLGTIAVGERTKVEVVDSVDAYLAVLKEVFDFDLLKSMLDPKATGSKRKVKILVDCMNGVMGPYARRILVEELGAPEESVMNAQPLPDFGGCHPDPNRKHAHGLIERMQKDDSIDIGCAFDGDGDRNMILGQKGYFVTPGDSLAVIVMANESIKFFKQNPIKGVARSFPTSQAVDFVAKAMNIPVYETPTGWKYFCNLLDAGRISICGEESFGTGSNHIREKDGMWAFLAWLSILYHHPELSVEDLCKSIWEKYGRVYFSRYDFEDLDVKTTDEWWRKTRSKLTAAANDIVGKNWSKDEKRPYVATETGDWTYVDPVDNSKHENQGLFIRFKTSLSDDSQPSAARIVIRKSGTSSSGTTVRFYFDFYHKDTFIHEDPYKFNHILVEAANSITGFKEMVTADEPTCIT